jgi:hypothetical protein
MGHCTRSFLALALIGLAFSCAPRHDSENTRSIADEIEKLDETMSQKAIAALIRTDAVALRDLGLSAARTQFALRDFRLLNVTPISETAEFVSDGTSHGVYSRLYRIPIGGGRYLRIRCIFDGPTVLIGLNLIEDPSPGVASIPPTDLAPAAPSEPTPSPTAAARLPETRTSP